MPSSSRPSNISGADYRHGVDLKTDTVVLDGLTSWSNNWTDTVTYGDNIPDWRRKLKDGQSATTSLTGTKVTCRFTSGTAQVFATTVSDYRYDARGRLGIDTNIPSENPTAISSARADSEALGKFARRIIETNTSFQGGIFLGELAQTIQMIKNPAKGLRGLADSWRSIALRIRRQKIAGSTSSILKKLTENLADAWLEVQFGWRPLIHDIDSGCKALSEMTVGRALGTRRITAKAEVNETSSEIPLSVNSPAGGFMRVGRATRTVGSCIVVYRGAMRVHPRSPGVMDPQLFGFNPGSWLPTVWELIPYSFLIDYFTNIGDMVNGVSTLGTSLTWCNRTIKRTYTKTSYAADWNPQHASATSHSIVPSKFVCTKSHVSRAVYSGTFVPGITFEIPDKGSLRWLNIAALIASRNTDRKWVYGD